MKTTQTIIGYIVLVAVIVGLFYSLNWSRPQPKVTDEISYEGGVPHLARLDADREGLRPLWSGSGPEYQQEGGLREYAMWDTEQEGGLRQFDNVPGIIVPPRHRSK